VHLYRGLKRGAGVRVDLTVQRNLFELWCGPFHGFCPFRKQHSLRIMERHFAYQTLGAVSRWIQSCGGKRVSQCREWRSDPSTWLTVGDQAVLVETQRRELNAREALKTRDESLASSSKEELHDEEHVQGFPRRSGIDLQTNATVQWLNAITAPIQ
jgi:hypothetical protein